MRVKLFRGKGRKEYNAVYLLGVLFTIGLWVLFLILGTIAGYSSIPSSITSNYPILLTIVFLKCSLDILYIIIISLIMIYISITKDHWLCGALIIGYIMAFVFTFIIPEILVNRFSPYRLAFTWSGLSIVFGGLFSFSIGGIITSRIFEKVRVGSFKFKISQNSLITIIYYMIILNFSIILVLYTIILELIIFVTISFILGLFLFPILLWVIKRQKEIHKKISSIRESINSLIEEIENGLVTIKNEIDQEILKGQSAKIFIIQSKIDRLIYLERAGKLKKKLHKSVKLNTNLSKVTSKLEEKKGDLTERLKISLNSAEEFFSYPNINDGQKLLNDLETKIKVCNLNDLKDLESSFTNAFKRVEDQVKMIENTKNQIINLEDSYKKGEFGYVLGEIPYLEKTVRKNNLTQFVEPLEFLSNGAKEGIGKKMVQIHSLLQEAQGKINQYQFDEARDLIKKSEGLAISLNLEKVYDTYNVNFEEWYELLENSENNYNVYNALIMYSKEYPRILLSELVKYLKIEEHKVEKIIKHFITNEVIPAKFDEKSKGITFYVVMDEINKLMETFDEWAKSDEGKKI